MCTREICPKKEFDISFPIQLAHEQYNEKGYYFSPHWHEEIEFYYVTEGSAKITLEHQEYLLEKGSMVIVNANELHSGYCESAPYSCKIISFNPQDLTEEISSLNIIFRPLVVQNPQVDFYIKQIFNECEEKDMGYMDNCRALLIHLLVYLSRNYAVEMQSDRISKARRNNLVRLNQILRYIDEHLADHISNQELADMVYLSENRFGHLFRQNVGISPQLYINQLRMQKAEQLVLSTDYSITEIARMVGFHDYNYFGRQFRQYFGCTPREMRKHYFLNR